MINKKFSLLSPLLISMSAANLCANELDKESTLPDGQIKTKSLNLEIDPTDFEETTEQQNTLSQNKKNPLLPDIFKDQRKEKGVSMNGGILMKNEAIDPESMDGAEISIKVKTN